MVKTDNRKYINTSNVIEKLLNHIDFGLIVVDVDLVVYYWNDWLSLQSGITSEEIEGKLLSDFFTNFNVKTLKRKIKTSLSLNTQTFYNASSSKYLLEIEQKKVLHSKFDTFFMQQDVVITPYDKDEKLVLIKINDQSEISAKNSELAWLNGVLEEEKRVIDTNILTLKIDTDHNIYDISTAYVNLFEQEKDELISRSYFDMIDYDCSKVLKSSLKQKKHFCSKHTIQNKSDKKIYLNSQYIPHYNELDEFIGYTIISSDETSSVLLHEQQKIILQQSRHAAMGEMISMIAHQWRQPLSVINTVLAGIRFNFELGNIDEGELDQSFTKVENTVQFLSSTINDFKDYFRPNKSKAKVEVEAVIDKAVSLILPTIRQNGVHYIYNSKCDEVLEVSIHENELVQIIINLLKNALDAITANKTENREIELTLEVYEDSFTISVKDSGGGVPKELQEKIFEPYFSTKSKNGTGLGLYMSKMIIEDHFSGKIYLESEGEYTTFILNIPIKSGL